VKIFNLHGDDWDRAEERKGWRSKDACGKIGARSVAGERILLSRPGPVLDYWDGED